VWRKVHMIIIRFSGLLLLAFALMLLGADVVSAFEADGDILTRSLDQIIAMFTDASAMSWIEASLPPSLASLVTIPLRLPAWLSIGVIGVLLAAIARSGRD
jgi:hypothetical protein